MATNVDGVTEQGFGTQAMGVGAGESVVPNQEIACRDERGMVSAEWAVGIIAAIAVAGVLLAVVTEDGVQDALLGFILKAISFFTEYIKK